MSNKKYLAVVIVALVLIGGGMFYGGTVYEKNKLAAQKTPRLNNFFGANGQQKGLGQGIMGLGRNNDGGFVGGEIISKDDKSITIKTRDGGSKIIYFSNSTTIGKSMNGASSDLNTGQQVTVSGKASSDGSVSAQDIQIRPAQQ